MSCAKDAPWLATGRFTYSEGKRYGFALATFSKVIRELILKGFVDPVDKGGLRSDGKSYNLFKLSRRWEQYGTATFKRTEWRCFQPRPRIQATSKSKMNSFKKRNVQADQGEDVSQIEAVAAVSRL